MDATEYIAVEQDSPNCLQSAKKVCALTEQEIMSADPTHSSKEPQEAMPVHPSQPGVQEVVSSQPGEEVCHEAISQQEPQGVTEQEEMPVHPSQLQLVKYVSQKPWDWMGLMNSLGHYHKEEQVHSDEEIEVCGEETIDIGEREGEERSRSGARESDEELQIMPKDVCSDLASTSRTDSSQESHSSRKNTKETVLSQTKIPAETPADLSDMLPPLKKKKLMVDTANKASIMSDKAIQFPSDEDIDDGYSTVFQALPNECAREHAFIPNIPSCQPQVDQLDPSNSDDSPDGQSQEVTETSEELPGHTPPQTLLEETSLYPAVAMELENQLVPEEICRQYYSDQSLYSDTDKKMTTIQPLSLDDQPDVKQQACPSQPSHPPSCFQKPLRAKLGGGDSHGLVNFGKPRLRLGLSKRQKCRSLHDNY